MFSVFYHNGFSNYDIISANNISLIFCRVNCFLFSSPIDLLTGAFRSKIDHRGGEWLFSKSSRVLSMFNGISILFLLRVLCQIMYSSSYHFEDIKFTVFLNSKQSACDKRNEKKSFTDIFQLTNLMLKITASSF